VALSITFGVDKESQANHVGMNLLMKEGIPYSKVEKLLEEETKRRRYDVHPPTYQELRSRYFTFEMIGRVHKISISQPLVYWMNEFIKNIQIACAESFHWNINYYLYRQELGDDGESAVRYSAPCWFIIVRNARGECMHKNWTAAFDMEGDFWLLRGEASDKNPIFGTGYSPSKKSVERFIDAIKAKQRLTLLTRENMRT
jgi:hypothetical protein